MLVELSTSASVTSHTGRGARNLPESYELTSSKLQKPPAAHLQSPEGVSTIPGTHTVHRPSKLQDTHNTGVSMEQQCPPRHIFVAHSSLEVHEDPNAGTTPNTAVNPVNECDPPKVP